MLETSGIPSAILNAMKDKGYEKLTPVQEEVGKKRIFRFRLTCFSSNRFW